MRTPRRPATLSMMAIALGSFSACALAQPTNLQFYMWNPEPYGWTHDSRYMPMVRIYVENKTGADAATEVIAAINSRLGSVPPTIQAGKVCVLLQNYASDEKYFDGTDWNPFNSTTALTRGVDEVSVSSWHLFSETISQNPRNQVWFKPYNSNEPPGANLAEWMDDFIAEFGVSDPVIDRFHLDVETAIAPCCDANHMQVLLVSENDPRWDTEDVPGFGQTMAQLWVAATTDWGLSQPTLLNDLLEVGEDALDTSVARQIYLWYAHVAQRARAAVLNETTFLPLTAKWEDIVCSNYEDSHLDNATDTFGWFYDWPASPGPSPELTNTATRSFAVYNNLGFDNTPYDQIYPTHEASGRFFWVHTSTFANHGSPVLYSWSENHRNKNPYTHPSAPIETQWEASLRNQRRWLEAEINSRDVGDHGFITPWIAMVGTTITFPGNYTVTLDDAVRQLSLLRQKRISNVLVWGDEATTEEHWCLLDAAHQIAYSVYIVQSDTSDGADVGANSSALLEDTLRFNDGVSDVESVYKIAGAYSHADGMYIASIDVQFTGINSNLGCGLSIEIEMSVNACDASTTVYLQDFTTSNEVWLPVDIYNDGTHVDGVMIYTRVSDLTTRRRILIPDASGLISSTGGVELRIVTTSVGDGGCCETPGPSCPQLEVAIDLVQITQIPGYVTEESACNQPDCAPPAEPLMGQSLDVLGVPLLADLDLTGRVTERDIDRFMSSWLSQTGRDGDYVRDGVYDEMDAAAFLSDYLQAIE